MNEPGLWVLLTLGFAGWALAFSAMFRANRWEQIADRQHELLTKANAVLERASSEESAVADYIRSLRELVAVLEARIRLLELPRSERTRAPN